MMSGMSLIRAIDPTHQQALDALAETLREGGARDGAVLLNLQEEDRVPPAQVAAFQHAIADGDGARSAIDPACSALARCLPTREDVAWSHHVTLNALVRHGYARPIALDAAQAPPRVRLSRPCGTDAQGRPRALWVTTTRTADATATRDRLGLGHVEAAEVLYRIEVPMRDEPAFIPTALDAGTYPAWRRPPAATQDPWGLTRHLATDAPTDPELVVVREAAAATRPPEVARHLGAVTTSPSTGYLAHRTPRP